MSETVFLPSRPPAEAAQPLQPAELTEEQKKMQENVLLHFEDAAYKPTGSDTGLSDEEKNVDIAKARLQATILWRREYGIYDKVTAEHVEPELLPSRQNTTEPPQQIQYTVWMLERCIDMMPAGIESLDLLIDYADKAKNPSLGTARTVLNILQDHYPERLGLALILNVPFLLNAFYKLITPFIDPVTRLKMKFNPKVVEEGIFAPNMVTENWGGATIFNYRHEEYWPALVAMTNERRALWMENWRAMGAKVGLKEVDYKKGTPKETPTESIPSTAS
ncbi:CRAL/TRIO domain-containing protein [Mycena amicta]|nr:CRAL/TRIO domain-containing protein [Mycena amicta]